MAKTNRFNAVLSVILIGTILAAMLAALFLCFQRHRLEAKNRQVELAVEYSEVMRLAQQSGLSFREVLAQLKEAGATAVFFKEQGLDNLSWQVWTRSGNELLSDGSLSPGTKAQLKPEYTYLLTRDKKLHRRILKQLQIKLPKVEALENPGGPYLVGTPLPAKQFENIGATGTIGLGFPEEDMAAAEEMGLNLQVQIKSWPRVDNDDFSAYFSSLARFKRLDLVLFIDKTIPGFPGKYLLLQEEIAKLGVPVGLIELYDQKGFVQLAKALDKNVVRLHSIAENQMPTMSPEVAVDRFTLAVTDRNIRAILVRLFLKPESEDWLTSNVQYISKVRNSIEAQGFTFGRPEALEGPLYYGFLNLVIGLGVIAGGVLLLRLLGWQLPAYGLGALAVFGWLALIAGGHVTMARKLMALAAVVIFPSLAILLNLEERGTSIGRSIVLLLRTSLISLVGALFTVGLLADVNFMLKLDQFSGVKAAHVLPLLIVVVFLFWRLEKQNAGKRLIEFSGTHITVGYAALAAVLAIAFAIYIARTGNDAAPVSGLELSLRSWLDKILVVRPRTKEFLIGHPLLLLTFYLGYRHRLLPVLLLGAIGQISMVNTFAHIHTPLAVSLFRAFNGLWLGVIIGVILIFAYRLAEAAGRRLFHG